MGIMKPILLTLFSFMLNLHGRRFNFFRKKIQDEAGAGYMTKQKKVNFHVFVQLWCY